MLIIQTKTGLRRISPGSYKQKTWPKLRHQGIISVTVTESDLLIVNSLFKNIPIMKNMDSVIYPGELGLFVYLNLKEYHSRTKTLEGFKGHVQMWESN